MQQLEYDVPAHRGQTWALSATFVTVALILIGGIGLSFAWQLSVGPLYAAPPIMAGVTLSTSSAAPSVSFPDPPVTKKAFGPPAAPTKMLVQLPQSYTLPIRYGTLGPQLVAGGVIDLEAFLALYAEEGKPLSAEQQKILTGGSDAPVVIDRSNAHFLLNFFWAAGLANRNPILLEGPLAADGAEQLANYSSTGGWTLAARPVMDVYASLPLVTLTEAQQKRLQTVADNVYRPCCSNSTALPDCNHGMAMLAVLELMAANDADEDQMYDAAKHLSAFWFPSEMQQVAAYFKLTENLDFAAVDPRLAVSHDLFSSAGAQAVREWLSAAGQLGD